MADIKLEIGAEEQVSDAARRAAAGLAGLERALDGTEKQAKATDTATGGLVKAQGALSAAVTGVNQALELGAKAWSVASRAAQAFGDYVQEGAKEAIAAEKAQRQLYAALGSGTERITAMTSALQRRTGADADAMNQQAATLASMGLTTDQIERAIPALRAYAEVTGKDASRAVQSLGQSFADGKVEEKIAALSQFIPAADAATDSFGGTVDRLTRNLGELQEEIGSSVTESETLARTLNVLDEEVIALTGSAEGLGPLIGDQLASGLNKATAAAGALADAAAELIDPTTLAGKFFLIFPRMVGDIVAHDEMMAAAAGLRAIRDEAEKTAAAMEQVQNQSLEADGLISEIPAGELAKRTAAAAAAEERKESAKADVRKKAAKDAAKALEDEEKSRRDFAQALAERYEKERIDGMNASLREQSRIMEEDAKAATQRDEDRAKRIRKWWGEQEKINNAEKTNAANLAKQAEDDKAKALQSTLDTIGDVGAYASMGASAMQAFAAGMAAESTSDKVKGILAGVLQVVGAAIGFFATGGNPAGLMAGAGAGGAVGGLFSSLPFRDGGAPLAYELPAARGGAVVIGDTDRDGRIVQAHSGEGILTAQATQRLGGIQAVQALNRGGSPAAPAAGTTINVVALDPMTAVRVLEKSVEPAQVSRMQARQGAKWRREIQRAARGPSNGGGR